jgi:hypothetical protein
MRRVCKLYVRLCKRFGPCNLTISAWAWKRELEGRGYLLRELIDDAFLVWRGEDDHCRTRYERETAPNPVADVLSGAKP